MYCAQECFSRSFPSLDDLPALYLVTQLLAVPELRVLCPLPGPVPALLCREILAPWFFYLHRDSRIR